MNVGAPVFAGIVVLAILVVGSTVVLVSSGPTATQSITSPSTSTSVSSTSSTSTSTGSTDGLALRLSLNASVVSQGQGVSLSMGEWNTLDVQNEVKSSNAWPVHGLGVGPCGPLNYPFGFEIVSGYYADAAGLNSAQKVQLYEPGEYPCPMILSGITGYSFYPLSDVANVTGPCASGISSCFSEAMNMTVVVSRYWNGNSSAPLSAGTYTVVVGDEWGSLLLGHFEVAAGSGRVILPEGTTLQVSSSYDCVAGHYSVPFAVQDPSVFMGGFNASRPGVTLYVATAQQASTVYQGHPSAWVFSTGLQNSTHFVFGITAGSYVAWIEGADLNCGATIVTPLEQLTTVNITEAFATTDTFTVSTLMTTTGA
jgi:hypothetical protein